MSDKRVQAVYVGLLALLVAAIVVIVHWPILDAQALCFDDDEAIVNNPLIRDPSWHSVGRFFTEITQSSVVAGYYRPLTLTSLMLDWSMGGRPDDLRSFHRTSLALHVGSTMLIVLLCYQIFGRPVVAAMVGLLFGLHPMTVEPIAWVMERKTILAAIFAFGCLNAYVRFTKRGGKRWYVAAVVLYLISLLAKPTVTPLPVMILLMDYWPLKRFSRRAIIEKVPFFILAAMFALLCVICELKVNPLMIPARLSPLHLPLRLCWLAVFYPHKILLPLNLTSVYSLPDPLTLTNPVILLAVVLVVLILTVLILFSRWLPALWVSASIFYVGLSPTMGFVGYSWVSASDKYVYLPAVGLALLLAWLFGLLIGVPQKNRPIWRSVAFGMACVIVAILLSVLTRQYIAEWQTTERHELYMQKLAPNSPETNFTCANLFFAKGEYDRAIALYTRVIELDPDDIDIYNNRGNAYAIIGEFDHALQDYERAIQMKPEHTETYYNRGVTYDKMGQFGKAIVDYTKAIDLNPEYAEAYYGRGGVYYSLYDYGRAILDYDKAIILNSDFGKAYHDRANAYFANKDYKRAIVDYSTAATLMPDDAVSYCHRGNAYLQLSEFKHAINDYNQAIILKRDYVEAYNNRAVACYSVGDYDQAWSDVAQCRKYGGQVNPEFIKQLAQISSRQ